MGEGGDLSVCKDREDGDTPQLGALGEGWGFIKHIIMHKMYLSCHPEKLYLMFPMNGRWIKDLSLH